MSEQEPARPCKDQHQPSPDTCRTCWYAYHGTDAQKVAIARAAGVRPTNPKVKTRKIKYEKADGTVVTVEWEGSGTLREATGDFVPFVAVELTGKGPGTELQKMLKSFPEVKNCQCKVRVAEMDAWGVEKCRENLPTIVKWLEEAWAKLKWYKKLKAAGRAVAGGYLTTESMVLEAIRRAEADRPTS